MIIEVNPALLDLIKTIEERERKDSGLDLKFSWAYYSDGDGASGMSVYYHAHGEYDLSLIGTHVHAQRRELDKWSNDDWETDPLDSDYEADEEEDN